MQVYLYVDEDERLEHDEDGRLTETGMTIQHKLTETGLTIQHNLTGLTMHHNSGDNAGTGLCNRT